MSKIQIKDLPVGKHTAILVEAQERGVEALDGIPLNAESVIVVGMA